MDEILRIRGLIASNIAEMEAVRAEIRSLDTEGGEGVDEKLTELEGRVKTLEEERSRLDTELVQAEAAAQEQRNNISGGNTPPVSTGKINKAKTLIEVRSSEEYANAFADYIKTGDAKECRALLTDLVDGTIPVPTMISDAIETAWTKTNLVQRVRRTNIKGVANYPFEYSATGASIHVEGSERPEEEILEWSSVEIVPQTLKKWITISDEVLALKGTEFLNYITAEIVQRIMELADSIIVDTIKDNPTTAVKADKKNNVKGAAGVPKLTLEKITFATIFNALALLADGATNPVAVMHKQTYFNDIMALEDLQGRPIYNIVSDNGKPQYYVNGVEVVFNENLTAHEEIIIGDFNGMIGNFPESDDVKFITDPYSLAEYDLVKIVGRMMAGFGVVKDKYFVNVKIGGSSGGDDNSGNDATGGGTNGGESNSGEETPSSP